MKIRIAFLVVAVACQSESDSKPGAIEVSSATARRPSYGRFDVLTPIQPDTAPCKGTGATPMVTDEVLRSVTMELTKGGLNRRIRLMVDEADRTRRFGDYLTVWNVPKQAYDSGDGVTVLYGRDGRPDGLRRALPGEKRFDPLFPERKLTEAEYLAVNQRIAEMRDLCGAALRSKAAIVRPPY